MKILFLDFDGVLHPFFPRDDRSDEENQLFSYLPRLERVLREFSDLRVVITSSWRTNRSWDDLIKPFAPDIAIRIIGATPSLNHQDHSRFKEVLHYLDQNNLHGANWVALDDDPALYPADCSSLVLCEDGFREAEERALRNLLARLNIDSIEEKVDHERRP